MGYKRTHFLIKKSFQLRYTLTIAATMLVIMLVSVAGLYVGMWGAIIENFSRFNVSENLETAQRIAGYEEARFGKGDFRFERLFREAELLSAKEQEMLHNALVSVNKSLVPKLAILVIVMFLGGIFVSHRIAGPMYRFEKSAEAIRSGDLSASFHIRHSDEMQETAGSLEAMAAALRDDIEKIKKLNRNAEIDKILAKYKT